jgi:hypothetical protein
MARLSSGRLRKLPGEITSWLRSRKNRSTKFSHDEEVGVNAGAGADVF